MTALLDVHELGKRFGGVEAVAGLTFTVGEGEIVGLIGPNGAGKSTAFDLINGVRLPDRGRVVLRGEDITGMDPRSVVRRGLARTHQIVQPLATMSVLENCMVGACFGRADLSLRAAETIARETADLVGLADRLGEPASQLTIAGKKRLELARALCAQPSLLLLDEVLAGLEAHGKRAFTRLLLTLHERYRIAILIIEHDIEAIMNLCPRVAVLDFGKLIADGAPADVFRDPAVIASYTGVATHA